MLTKHEKDLNTYLDRPGSLPGADQRDDYDPARPSGRDIPEPLTAGQIDVFTIDEVNEAVSKVAMALQRGHPDDETETRLKLEFKLLWERKRALQ